VFEVIILIRSLVVHITSATK